MTITRSLRTPIMHRVVTHNGVAYFGGVVATDVSGGMREQTQQITSQLDELLAKVGSDRTKILAATIYITDMGQKNDMTAVWTDWIAGDDLPTRATIGVADLGENVLIEVVISAAI